jgi:hypothetical protein
MEKAQRDVVWDGLSHIHAWTRLIIEIEPGLSAESRRLLKQIQVKVGVIRNMIKYAEALDRVPQMKKPR